MKIRYRSLVLFSCAQFWLYVKHGQILPHILCYYPYHPPPPFSSRLVTKTLDTDTLPNVKLAVTWLQKQRVLKVFLDYVHLTLVVNEIQKLCSLRGDEDAFT